MRYQEYEPPVALAPWVKLFWVFENQSFAPVPETIVADGFPELILHFRSPFAEEDSAGEILEQPANIACGQLTRPLILHSSVDAGMIGIRFQPGGMAPFISSSMQSLADARVAASELFDNIDQLSDEVMEAADDLGRVAACNRYLLNSFDIDRDNESIRRVVSTVIQEQGMVSVDFLASLSGKSRRSLEMAFQKEVGTTPKMFCRITRFRSLLDAVTQSDATASWVQIALDAGFFDQSHLNRDFRRFTGESPTNFLADQTNFAHSVN